jgi:hypothetical protein
MPRTTKPRAKPRAKPREPAKKPRQFIKSLPGQLPLFTLDDEPQGQQPTQQLPINRGKPFVIITMPTQDY